ncbi:uncharacterized protein LOC103821976 [Serinus canaria]|uniref:uncharacterized protein LOC103821976 n=1 Tax=Serinus canaria TaxID=9135 RepID=UPI0021CC8D26|nr:uncharacterized protein LOC103821976 [Serinus canaria]
MSSFVLWEGTPFIQVCTGRLHLGWLLLPGGLREVGVVEVCHCSICPEGWLGLLALQTFQGDSWEITIHVGKCSDPTYSNEPQTPSWDPDTQNGLLVPSGCWMPKAGCSMLLLQETQVQLQFNFPSCFLADGLFCVPTKFSTALVKNPRGEMVQTPENWEMKEKCYCVSQVEYYEIVQRSAGHREERLKEIDVGRCLGSCSSGDPCLLRELQDGEECLVWAQAAPRGCAPHGSDRLRFRSRRDQVRTVAAIRECRGERGWKLRVGLLETPPDCL